MSWITQCPHCKTKFRVHQGQLNARHGLVCCGRCQSAFNASEQLIPSALETRQPESGERPFEESSPKLAATLPELRAMGSDEGLSDVPASLPSAPSTLQTPSEPTPATQSNYEPTRVPELARPSSNRLVWGLGIFALCLALLLQLTHTFRNQFSASMPALRPALVAYCHLAGCTIELPKRAELLTLETSSLDASKGGEMELSALIRNRASFRQKYPDIQLDLTDPHDTIIARKIIRPSDYLISGRSTAEGLAAESILEIHLPVEISGAAPTGYKLLLFFSPESTES